MLDRIISELKDKIGGDLVQKTGLTGDKADAAVNEAGASLKNITENKEPSSLMEMLSGGGAAGLSEKFGQDYLGA